MKNLKIFFVIVFSFFNFVLQAQNIGKPSPIDTKGMSSSDYLAFLQKSNPKSFIVAGKNFENAVPNQMITATENKTLKGTYNFTFFFSEKELFATVITKNL